jgi:hypothetical protein
MRWSISDGVAHRGVDTKAGTSVEDFRQGIGIWGRSSIIHWLGRVTRDDLAGYWERTVVEGIPVRIWKRTRSIYDMPADPGRRLTSRDGSVFVSPQDSESNEYWYITRLRK